MLLQIFLIFSDVLNVNVATEIFALREGGNIFFKLVIPFQKQVADPFFAAFGNVCSLRA